MRYGDIRIIHPRARWTTIFLSCGKNWRETLRILCISKPCTASVTSSFRSMVVTKQAGCRNRDSAIDAFPLRLRFDTVPLPTLLAYFGYLSCSAPKQHNSTNSGENTVQSCSVCRNPRSGAGRTFPCVFLPAFCSFLVQFRFWWLRQRTTSARFPYLPAMPGISLHQTMAPQSSSRRLTRCFCFRWEIDGWSNPELSSMGDSTLQKGNLTAERSISN